MILCLAISSVSPLERTLGFCAGGWPGCGTLCHRGFLDWLLDANHGLFRLEFCSAHLPHFPSGLLPSGYLLPGFCFACCGWPVISVSYWIRTFWKMPGTIQLSKSQRVTYAEQSFLSRDVASLFLDLKQLSFLMYLLFLKAKCVWERLITFHMKDQQ